MAIIEIPCPHNYHSINVPGLFTRKRVDVVIRFRIIERFIIHLADGTTPPLTTVNDGGVISRGDVHPGCPDCKASLTSSFLAHDQSSEDCSTLLNLIADRLADGELDRHDHHHLKYFADVEFAFNYHRLSVNDDDDDVDDDDEVEEVALRLTPAIDGAIHALERITLSTSEEVATTTTSVCAICLEDLMKNNSNNNEDEEEVGRRLPCKHEFHEDCIIEWLHTSHYCPLCRFELPAYTA